MTEQEMQIEEEEEVFNEEEEVEEPETDVSAQTTQTVEAEPEYKAPTNPPATFSCRLPAYVLHEAIKSVNAVVKYAADSKDPTDAVFQVTENGLVLRQMDHARVAMVNFSMSKNNFETFTLKTAGSICFMSGDLIRVLKRAKRQIYNEDGTVKIEGDMLNMTVEGNDCVLELNRANYKRKFTLKAIEPETEMIDKTPVIKNTVMMKYEPETLQNALVDAAMAGDCISMCATKEGIKVSTQDVALGYEAVLPKPQQIDASNIEDEASATYSLGYLTSLMRNLPKETEQIVLSYASNMPLTLKVYASQFETLEYFLAPRISSD